MAPFLPKSGSAKLNFIVSFHWLDGEPTAAGKIRR
jgi:hypothetical protein